MMLQKKAYYSTPFHEPVFFLRYLAKRSDASSRIPPLPPKHIWLALDVVMTGGRGEFTRRMCACARVTVVFVGVAINIFHEADGARPCEKSGGVCKPLPGPTVYQ